ncbi:MAG: diacylglycerol/lipid kinase family protein [Candidatus Bipolaricaulota bacterium]
MIYKIIANTAAGRGKVLDLLPEIERTFIREGLNYDLERTKYPGEAIDLAAGVAGGGYEAVVAVGGDGTIREVASGLVGTGVALGIIPSGMGNDLARSLSIPDDVRAAIKVLRNPGRRRLDLGRDNGRYFAGVLGLGFPVEVMQRINSVRNWFVRGSGAFLLAVLGVLYKLDAHRLKLEIDGQELEKNLVALFIMNTPYTGGGMHIIPRARPDDGYLDLALVGDLGTLELARELPRVYKGTHTSHHKVSFFRARSIKVSADPADHLLKMYDGDVMGKTPVDAHIIPGALEVLVPREGIE